MIGYVVKRLLSLIPVWIILSVVSFALLHIASGSPAALLLGPEATESGIRKLDEQLGLNDPLMVQYLRWVGDVARGDLGTSFFQNADVLPTLWSHFQVTLQLSVLAFAIAVVLGVTAGTVSAIRHGRTTDAVATFFSTAAFAVPEFVLGLLLVVTLAVALPVFPVQGYTPMHESPSAWIQHLILPAVTIGLILAGPLTRITRSAVLRTLNQDYMRTARSKGISPYRVVIVHALRSALLPTLTGMGLILTNVLGGTFVTEVVFNVPGVGSLMLTSALNRDFPILQGGILFIGTMVLLINLAIDLSYFVADPRVRSRS